MPTTALPVSLDTLPAVAAPGSAPADAAPGFAQALTEASAQLHDAAAPAHDAAAGDAAAVAAAGRACAPAEAATPTRTPDGGKPDAGCNGGTRKAPVAAERPVQTRVAATPETLAAIATEAPGPAPGPPDPTTETAPDDNTDMPPADLAAWVSSLPLPPPPPALAPPPAAPPAAVAVAGSARAARDPGPAAVGRTGAATLQTTSAAPIAPEAAAREAIASPVPASGAMLQAASAPRADTPAARHAPSAPTGSAAPRVDASADATAWMQALAAPEEAAVPRSSNDGVSALPALPGGTPVVWPRPSDSASAAPLQAEVRAEVGTKEFAPALGSQLAVLVRDGIDHAQLKLNPAELGPIEVRISVDGSQAQVDFSAAHAHTRQALQEAVPALAGALRDHGLTLTGGGVFEQPRESRGEARPDTPRGGPTGGEPLPEPRTGSASATRMTRSRGVVDLYA